ncbi:hypothetical protein OIV83_000933 [Microbotryomycetes sp. JL201]|nr:hypothetical protein OIV83_000933 [Microbotryomycetes sp. JL201]
MSNAPDERQRLLPGQHQQQQSTAGYAVDDAPAAQRRPSSQRLPSGQYRRYDGAMDDESDASRLESADKHQDRSRLWRRVQRVCSPNILLLIVLLAAIAWLITTRELQKQPHRQSRAYRDSFHMQPAKSLDPAGIKVDGPRSREEHSVTAIVIHGLGDTSHGLFYAYQLGPRFPFVKWVAPQARFMNITVSNGASLSAWYDISSFEDLHYNEDERGMIESQRELNELIRAERQELSDQGKEPRIVVCGFSQGAVMTLLNTLSSKEPIDAALMLAGYLPLPHGAKKVGARPSSMAYASELKFVLSQLARFADRNTPIFWAHGTADPVLRQENAAKDVKTLLKSPFSFHILVYKVS